MTRATDFKFDYLRYLAMKKLITMLLLITVSVSGLANAVADEATAINALNIKWDTAVNQGDTMQLASLYVDNAVMMPPSSEILSDRGAIKNYWDNLREVGIDVYAISTVDLRIDGDTAYQTVLWDATRNAADGNVIQFNGNMSNVLERQKDGTWKIKLQSWN
ncbi:MAG: hypothetical protein A3I13_01210 [Gammaproteobacteria bacterium RIFCSPLOWO2_02_FULL_47_50]|nr:MAG: hypothetical protein A2993_01315 [Gammaproteobacteria bacterium RIFCSPLOWO2_01_FULL_47_190]OGT72185.1 MAG: hypothetical protein A2W76_05020 [Gammaproteobacteria bacterium RIFCSPLOWO2_12_47_11]OGT78549.1 MAG: hypothetical protein A3I13_01210 [Gammaproteobacteria bacterium RIFCSPLOWO2_02_FULL_47_50]OGT83429.1 MAG: hypothetical protein A3G42_05980 [Gammaproteobacteria bacterium RIFCSPLOWO2_12_FULL_47_76]